MNILLDARMINSSTGRYAERLLHYLQVIDQENNYRVLVRASDRDFWTPSNPRFKVVVADYKYYSFAEQIAYLFFLNRFNADLVHFMMPQQPVLYRKPHVTTIHDLTLLNTYNSDKNWLIYHAKQLVGRFVFKRVAHTSTLVLTPSEYTKQGVVDFASIKPEEVLITYEAADALTADPVAYALPTDNYLLYVGQQSDYKNIRRLIVAHQELLERHPSLHLVLVGGKNNAVLKNEAWVKDNNYSNVIFTGFVSDGHLAGLYKNAACYVFPSLMEGFGLPGLEAMRMGSPVASSDATCLPEIYADAAIYFNPKDPGDIAAKIDAIISDPARRNALIAAGYVRVNDFSWEKMAEQTLAAYRRATA